MSEHPSENESAPAPETSETVDVEAPRTDAVEKSDRPEPSEADTAVVMVDSPQTDSVEFSEPPSPGSTFDLSMEDADE